MRVPRAVASLAAAVFIAAAGMAAAQDIQERTIRFGHLNIPTTP